MENSDEDGFLLRFDGLEEADANVAANDLHKCLDDLGEPITVRRTKPNTRTLDFGTTLVLVLGAPAAVSLANGIADWLKTRANGSLVIIDRKSQKVVARGKAAERIDAAALTRALNGS